MFTCVSHWLNFQTFWSQKNPEFQNSGVWKENKEWCIIGKKHNSDIPFLSKTYCRDLTSFLILARVFCQKIRQITTSNFKKTAGDGSKWSIMIITCHFEPLLAVLWHKSHIIKLITQILVCNEYQRNLPIKRFVLSTVRACMTT